jgi:Zn-dependent peptidase ImmA (M78 family)/transcriptional regulator with XRE-family HTH domain
MTIAESEGAARAQQLGQRLRAAREQVGLTQAQAAVELGVSRPLLIAMEKGTRQVTPAELVRLGQIFRTPLNELLRQSEPPTVIGARFRTALAAAPGSDEVEDSVNLLERSADDYLDLLRRSNSPLPGVYPPQVRTHDGLNIEVAAENLAGSERNRLGAGDGPLSRLREALEIEVGLRVFLIPLPARIAGLFVFVEELGGCVAVNSTHPLERRRWTMAHEYAHFLSTRNQPEVTSLPGSKRVSETERFADGFAANFLMPRAGLVRRFGELKNSKGGSVTPASLVQLAHSYTVSVQAMTLRLEDLALIPDGTWDKLSDHRFQPRTAAEQLGLQAPREVPEKLPLHYRNLAVQLFSDGQISESQLARYLHTDIVGARSSFQELTATHDVAEDGSLQILDLQGSE